MKPIYLEITLENGNVFYAKDGTQDSWTVDFKEQIVDITFLKEKEYAERICRKEL